MDIAGLFSKSSVSYQFVLVTLGYATRFPDAIPVRSVTTAKVAEELIKWYTLGDPDRPRNQFYVQDVKRGVFQPQDTTAESISVPSSDRWLR